MSKFSQWVTRPAAHGLPFPSHCFCFLSVFFQLGWILCSFSNIPATPTSRPLTWPSSSPLAFLASSFHLVCAQVHLPHKVTLDHSKSSNARQTHLGSSSSFPTIFVEFIAISPNVYFTYIFCLFLSLPNNSFLGLCYSPVFSSSQNCSFSKCSINNCLK